MDGHVQIYTTIHSRIFEFYRYKLIILSKVVPTIILNQGQCK
jgi:hypothetical protein